jgi:hypothetical protein
MSTPAQISPLQAITFKKSDFTDDDSLSLFNQSYTNVVNQLNNLLGFNGPIPVNAHLNLQGNRILNVGAAVDPSDAVSQSFGNTQYGASALKPYFEALGKQVMQTYRRLSDKNQREQYSSFLNQILNTAPTANTSFVDFGAPGGGTISATVTAGYHQRVDSSVVPYTARTDTLTLPTAYSISSIALSGGIVTVVTSSPTGLVAGNGFSATGVTDTSFDGTFAASTVVGTTITYVQGGPNASSGGGNISVGGVYYYNLAYGQSALGLVGGFSSDTWSNRVQASQDGTTIIAVVVTNSSGGDGTNSAGGATPPVTGSAVAVVRRL